MLLYLASTAAGARVCLYELLGFVLAADPKPYI
jgi:hypothetical protein